MLTVITAQPVHPEVEAIDRDPGIITLLSQLVRAARRIGRTAPGTGHRKSVDAGLFSSATAWPRSER